MDINESMRNLMNLTGICPILVNADENEAADVARAMVAGGLPMMEILMRNESSYNNLATIAKEAPECFVGAGTVVTVDQCKRVIDLGAKFCVLPGFNAKIVEECQKNNIMVLPGCVTPTEIMMAMDYGLDAVKFFPVYEMGGLNTLNQYHFGPFGRMKFVVTGGLTSANFLPLLDHPAVLAAGGDWMFADHDAIKNHDYEQIARNCRESVMRVQDMRNAKTRK